MSQPLAGMRVLDFGRYVAGPYCAALLGYLGAEVIRIEKRDGGEDRYMHPLAHNDDGSPREGSLIFHTGCNKRSLTLDPASPQGRVIVKQLVATADIVVANLPAAAMKSLGLDYDSLKSVREDIILVTQSAFGSSGPDAEKLGFDGVGQAMSGAMYFTGMPGAPVKAAAPYVDYSTAVMSAFGALSAIIERNRTGRGQVVEASLLRTALAVFGSFVTEESALGLGRVPTGNRVQTSAPSDCFATADGHVLVHVVGTGLFRRIGRAIGADDWLTDDSLLSDEARGLAADRLCDRLGAWCKTRTTEEVLTVFSQAGVPAGPVLSIAEAVANPHVEAVGWLKRMPVPGLDGVPAVVDLPLDFSSGPAGITAPPPALGADSDSLLRELGYDAAAIAALRADKVI